MQYAALRKLYRVLFELFFEVFELLLKNLHFNFDSFKVRFELLDSVASTMPGRTYMR